jgi:hypothetical protein
MLVIMSMRAVPRSNRTLPLIVCCFACLQVSADDGHVIRSLHDPAGALCHTLASAVQVGEVLYMGSLGTSHVCALELGQGAATAAA